MLCLDMTRYPFAYSESEDCFCFNPASSITSHGSFNGIEQHHSEADYWYASSAEVNSMTALPLLPLKHLNGVMYGIWD
jgi:hypothetical protein